MEKIQDGGKFLVTNGFYFLFYNQSQLPILNKNKKINNLIDNLRIDNDLRNKIKELKSNNKKNNIDNIILNIEKFNNIFENISNKKNLNLKYLYYILYLLNNYKLKNNNIVNILIKNELIKFNININNFNVELYTIKNFNIQYIIDFKDIKLENLFLFDISIIKKINENHKKIIINLIIYLFKINDDMIIKNNNLYSPTNISIINLMNNKNNLYDFYKKIPTYNEIVQELLFAFISANNSDLIKLSIIETNKFNSILNKILSSKKLKEKILENLKKEINITEEELDKNLNKLTNPEYTKLTYDDLFLENSKRINYQKKSIIKKIGSRISTKFNKNKYFFTLKYILIGSKHYEGTNNDFKNKLKDTQDKALDIINKLRIKTRKDYDSYLVFEVPPYVYGECNYLYSEIFKEDKLEKITEKIQLGGFNNNTTAFFAGIGLAFLILGIIYNLVFNKN